jgi:hypothetical protein
VMAQWMSARRASRIVRRRKRASQASVRSNTQRCRPPGGPSARRRGPRDGSLAALCAASAAVVVLAGRAACSVGIVGARGRGEPRAQHRGPTPAAGSSWRFAPLGSKPSSVPRPATTRWRLGGRGDPGRQGSGRSASPARSAPSHGVCWVKGPHQVILIAFIAGGSVARARLHRATATAASPHIRSVRQRTDHGPSCLRASGSRGGTILFGGMFQPGG